ncbi:MAG: thioesterase [Acidimicrobiia bacterium]|jgi:predicted thioesterase|nr:thioesterase [Acidimicrobiia bacterium]
MTLTVGLRGEAKMTVSCEDTARSLRSGVVEVLGTPRLIALCEEASCLAVDRHLTDAATTVGIRVRLDHLQPTPVGGSVSAEAVLRRIEGRRLTFEVSAFDDRGLVAAGKVTRVLVDEERFMSKCR